MTATEAYQDFFLAKELQGVARSTLDRYHYSIERFLTDLGTDDITAITTVDIGRWLGAKTYSEITPLRTFFNFLEREGYVDKNPMKLIPTPKLPEVLPKALSDSDVQKLIHAARKNPRDISIVLVFLDSAIRASELGGLNRADIDLDRMTIQIRNGKGGKVRQVYISPVTARAVRRYLSSRKDNDPAAFLSQRHNPMNRDSLRLLMYRLCDKAGIQRRGPSSLRHTSATSLARQGIDAWSLQQLLGHADNKVSLRYIWLIGRDVQEAHKRFSPVERLRLA